MKMKVVDTTAFMPSFFGPKKEAWVFRCDRCQHEAIFILYKGSGLSTACEMCLMGNMERESKVIEVEKE